MFYRYDALYEDPQSHLELECTAVSVSQTQNSMVFRMFVYRVHIRD